MIAIHTFKKRPGKQYLAQRRVSFLAAGEVDHVREKDTVHIEVYTGINGQVTNLTMSGKEFLANLSDKTSSKGVKIKVLQF